MNNPCHWELTNMTRVVLNVSDVCEPEAARHVLFPSQLTWNGGHMLCEQLGGAMTVVDDRSVDNQTIEEHLIDQFYQHVSNSVNDNEVAEPFYVEDSKYRLDP